MPARQTDGLTAGIILPSLVNRVASRRQHPLPQYPNSGGEFGRQIITCPGNSVNLGSDKHAWFPAGARQQTLKGRITSLLRGLTALFSHCHRSEEHTLNSSH